MSHATYQNFLKEQEELPKSKIFDIIVSINQLLKRKPKMPQIQIDVLASMYHNLPKIADELEKMNKLKALELRLKIDRTVKSVPELLDEVNKILKP